MIVKISAKKIIIPQGLLPRVFGAKEPVIYQYKEAMEEGAQFPPIKVWQKSKDEYWIIDGVHRFLAQTRLGREYIEAEVVELKDEIEFMAEAIKENAKHGLPLAPEDKRESARRLYLKGYEVKNIAKLFSVSHQTVYNWIGDLKEQEKEELREKVLELKEKGLSNREIARELGITHPTVENLLKSGKNFTEVKNLPPTETQEEEIDWDATGWNEEETEETQEEYDGSWDDWNDEEEVKQGTKTPTKKQEKQPEFKHPNQILKELKESLWSIFVQIEHKFGTDTAIEALEEIYDAVKSGEYKNLEEYKDQRALFIYLYNKKISGK